MVEILLYLWCKHIYYYLCLVSLIPTATVSLKAAAVIHKLLVLIEEMRMEHI